MEPPFAATISYKADHSRHEPGGCGGEPYAPKAYESYLCEHKRQTDSADDFRHSVDKGVIGIPCAVEEAPCGVDNAQRPVKQRRDDK